MHKFFELISVGEEIIQEGARWDAAKASGRSAKTAVFGGASATGKFANPVNAYREAKSAKALYQFSRKQGSKRGAALMTAARSGSGGRTIKRAAIGGVAAGGGGYAFKRRQEAAIEEGAVLDAGRAFGSAVWGGARSAGTRAGGGLVAGKNWLKKKGLGAAGRTGGALSSGMNGLSGNIARNPGKWGAGALATGGAGVGYGGYRLARKKESELPELSANLQEAFLKGLFKKKSLLKKGGEAVVGTASKTGGFLKKHKNAFLAGAAGGAGGFAAGRGSK